MSASQAAQTLDLHGTTLSRLEEAAQNAAREPQWLSRRRESAIAWFRSHGFPSPGDEAWRFTPVRPVVRVPFVPAPSVGPSNLDWLSEAIGPAGPCRVVVANGEPVSTSLATARGLRIASLRELLALEPELLEQHLGRHARTENGFAAENTALFRDGVAVIVEPGASIEHPVEIVHASLSGDAPAVSHPRVVVVAGENSRLTLNQWHLVSGASPHLTSSIIELTLGSGASVTHHRVELGSPLGSSVATVAVEQARDSRYTSRVFTFGGALSRLDLNVLLDGQGAACCLDGLYLARSGEHVDTHTVIDHALPHTTSEETYKGVLDGTGRAVFDGTVVVRRGAQKIEAHQQNRNLLLSNDAQINTKPHLEIDADDVRCSHGATVGRLDDAQVFYLRARGMDETVARAALTYAFAREIIERVEDDGLRRRLADRVSTLHPGASGIQELT